MVTQSNVIEGLKVTVSGVELRDLCLKREEHHESRVATYEAQIASMNASRIEGMNYTGGDPVRALEDKKSTHAAEADEMRFIAEHIDISMRYILGREDLVKLGIAKSRY